MNNYEQAEKVATCLANGLFEIARVAGEQLGLTGEASKLRLRAEQISADRFKVLVVGEFKRGKSTLLNALLGIDVLPQKVAPCTAVVTVIQYNSEPGVRVVFDDGRPDELLSPAEFRSSYELTVEDADLTPNGNFDRFSHVDHAVVHYPLELCRHRVELVDSPGLGEHQVRTQRVQRFLDRADAIVLVLDATQFLTQEEVHFLDMVLLPRGLKNIFFLVNRWNLLEESMLRPEDLDAQVAELQNRIRAKLTPFCVINSVDRSSERVFRVNALGALRARMRRPPSAPLLEASQVPAFEESLQRFLVEERGQVRNQVALSAMKLAANEVTRYIGAQLNLAGRTLTEMEAERARLQPKLERLRGIKKQIENFLTGQCATLQDRLVLSFQDHTAKMAKDLPEEVNKFGLEELTQGSLILKAITDFARDDENKFARKIEKHLTPKVTHFLETRLAEWQEAVVHNLMKTVMIEVDKYLQEEAAEYQRVMNEIEQQLGVQYSTLKTHEQVEHWLGGGHAAAIGDDVSVTGVGPGLIFDVSWLVAGLVTDITLHLTGVLLPVVGLVISGFRLYMREKSMREEMKRKLTEGLRQKLEEVARTLAAGIRKQVQTKFDGLRKKIGGSIDDEIALVDASLQTIIDRKREKEYSFEQEKARIVEARAAIDAVISRVQTAGSATTATA